MKVIDKINKELFSDESFRKQIKQIGEIGHENKTLVSKSTRRY